MKEKIGEVAAEVIKATPPVSAVTLSIMGFPISDWVQLAVLIYTLMQMHVLAKKNISWYQSLMSWLQEVLSGSRRKRQ